MMKFKTKIIYGLNFSLRPVDASDAEFIIKLRTFDPLRSQFINLTNTDVTVQRSWILTQKEKDDDYYFVIVNNITGEQEGLIGLYNVIDGVAEWGRWIVSPGSLASIESVSLILTFAFETLQLKEVYCRTIKANTSVVKFHDNVGFSTRKGNEIVKLNGQIADYVEHFLTYDNYKYIVSLKLKEKANKIFQRSLRSLGFKFEFHHLGIASNSIISEINNYFQIGYTRCGAIFVDEAQGIRGVFMEGDGCPRLEILENIEGSSTLDKWLTQSSRIYHVAYFIEKLDDFLELTSKIRWKTLRAKTYSPYFQSQICFLMAPNKQIIELIEKNE